MVIPVQNFLIHFDNVTLRVDGRDRFKDIQWTIRPGEQWAVIGPNGSGKSTLLRALLGQTPVSDGEIRYQLRGSDEEPAWDYPDGAIGYVSQDEHRALLQSVLAYHQARWTPVDDTPPLRVRDVISQRQYDLDERQRGIHELLGITHLLDRGLETLSNGEMRKTLIARALASSPKIVLLDAPYAGLDTGARKHLKILLGQLMHEGLSIIMSVQRPEELPRAVTHLMCMENNRIVVQGPRRAIMKTPAFQQWKQPPTCCADFSHATALFDAKRAANSSNTPLVEIKNASVAYDEAQILSNVSWEIRPGEKWVLRGPNGSGKSTLASLILGDNPQAYSNHVRVFGFLRGHGESLWEIKERLGWISPELHYQCGHMATCREIVCSGLYDTMGVYQDGSAREARQVQRWMRALDIHRWRDEYFGALSDGQQRLVLMARALVKEPPLLILDEPCQGLDITHRQIMLALLDALARQPATAIIYITHHTSEIPGSFTHELYLNAGRVLRQKRRTLA